MIYINAVVDNKSRYTDNLFTYSADEDVKANVYTTDGKLVRSAVKRNAALQGLPSGVYVVDGKKCVK